LIPQLLLALPGLLSLPQLLLALPGLPELAWLLAPPGLPKPEPELPRPGLPSLLSVLVVLKRLAALALYRQQKPPSHTEQ